MAEALDAALASGGGGGGGVKATEYKVEDSNVENIGSAEDKAARLAAAQTEKEWEGSGQAVGLEIWRVENRRTENDTPDFGVKRWPKEEYGRFYKGDSFIILNTFKKDPDSEKLSYDLHFWIGEESTQDEYGVAAYKTVELDDLLTGTMGSSPVQHRQCMGHESELFLSYFPDGLIIKEGGIESGFRHVEPSEYQPRLLQIQRRGGQSRAFEVDCKIDALDTSDCFILDSGSKIYVYHGPTSDPFEKNKSTSLAETMEAERGDGSERVDVDDDFWSILGGTEADASAVSEDSTVWQPPEWTEPVLYSMEDNTLEWVEVKKGAIEPTDIKNDDVMLLDCSVELFVCVGNDAPEGEKTSCMVKAQEFLKSSGKPIYVPITRVNEGQNPNKDSFSKCFEKAGKGTPTTPLPRQPSAAAAAAQAAASSGGGSPIASEKARVDRLKQLPSTPDGGESEARPMTPGSGGGGAAAAAEATGSGGALFTLKELQDGCPDGVKANAKEDALNDAEFAGALGVDREAFAKLPKWKRDTAKKKAGIF